MLIWIDSFELIHRNDSNIQYYSSVLTLSALVNQTGEPVLRSAVGQTGRLFDSVHNESHWAAQCLFWSVGWKVCSWEGSTQSNDILIAKWHTAHAGVPRRLSGAGMPGSFGHALWGLGRSPKQITSSLVGSASGEHVSAFLKWGFCAAEVAIRDVRQTFSVVFWL